MIQIAPDDRIPMALLLGFWGAFTLFLLASFVVHMIKELRMPKTYGPDTVPEVPEIPFSLNVVHEDPASSKKELRTHEFIAKPDPSSGDFYRFALASTSEGGGELLIVLAEILPRMIDDSDGTPFKWVFKPRTSRPTKPGDPDADVVVTFRGPDGEIYPEVERKRFEEFDAGSSRRRLHHLMFTDENAKVKIQTVAEIMKDLFAAAGKGPSSA